MADIKRHGLYQHRSGNKYKVFSIGKLQFDGVWYDSVNYNAVDEFNEPFNPIYTRTIEDFNASFTYIGDLK